MVGSTDKMKHSIGGALRGHGRKFVQRVDGVSLDVSSHVSQAIGRLLRIFETPKVTIQLSSSQNREMVRLKQSFDHRSEA
jgi:hypothetical protein